MFINRLVTVSTLVGGFLAIIVAFLYGNVIFLIIAAFLFTISINTGKE